MTQRLKYLTGGLFLYLALIFILMTFNAAAAQEEGDTVLDEYPCYLEKIELAARCLDLEVPLNWDDPEGPVINLHLAIVPAKGGVSEPDPLVILAGGPGQAATDYSPLLAVAFDQINQRRDIILIDQRGTGSSNPLECTGPTPVGFVTEDIITESVEECLASFDVDVRYFTSFDVLKDIEYARKILGIEQINIWGGSYGTRLGLLYMKLYPDSIRSAILDGVTPPNESLFLLAPVTAEDAWRKLAAACEAEADCNRAYPALDARLRALLEDLRQHPVIGEIRNPMTGQQVTGEFNDEWLAEVVRATLYQPSRSALLPLAIARAEEGDFTTLNALALDGAAWAGNTMAIGSTLSVLCSEDVSRMTSEEAARAGEGSFHRDYYYRFWQVACAPWPVRDVLAGYGDAVTAEIPTLILSGGLDPVTPALTGAVAEKSLPNVLHLVAANAGHNVSLFGCAPRLMADFVETASLEGIDGACLNDPVRPPFVITPLGPRP